MRVPTRFGRLHRFAQSLLTNCMAIEQALQVKPVQSLINLGFRFSYEVWMTLIHGSINCLKSNHGGESHHLSLCLAGIL